MWNKRDGLRERETMNKYESREFISDNEMRGLKF